MLKQFVDQLITDMELGKEMVKNENDSCSLHLEPDLSIALQEIGASICLSTSLVECPKENKEEFLLKAMTSNLFGRETGGAVLGLDSKGQKVTLSMFLPEQTSYHDFHDSLEDFVNYAEAWQTETAEFTKSTK